MRKCSQLLVYRYMQRGMLVLVDLVNQWYHRGNTASFVDEILINQDLSCIFYYIYTLQHVFRFYERGCVYRGGANHAKMYLWKGENAQPHPTHLKIPFLSADKKAKTTPPPL
jgi:hypothetical protein